MSGLFKKVVRWFSNPPTETNVEEQRGKRFINALKEWAGKSRATIVFDSTVDEFTDGGLFNKVMGKPNVALVGFTTDGDVFGAFYSVAVTEKEKDHYDSTIFAFSFESHGRCETPQRFAVKEEVKMEANVFFFKNNTNWGFVWFGVDGAGNFTLGNERSRSWCQNMSRGFDGLADTTLTGQNNTKVYTPPFHHCARLVAIGLSN